jgi:plasmid stabilization system protein ParE
MTYRVRFTPEAADDLERLYEFILSRDDADIALAERALAAIASGIATLESSPFTCRKAQADSPLLRELIIPFGSSGYVALAEVEDAQTVTILAVRHQREDDYY